MSDKAPASKPTLRESIGDGAPDFTETLTFVLEVIPVSPLLASPPGVPPIESNAPMPPALAEPAIPAAPVGPMQRPGSPLTPFVLGAGRPIVLEGHNITHFALDMATHGFTGEITFRVSESKWLGDPKEVDRLLRAFQGENILMLKLTIKPVFKDRKFTPYLTPEMVPKPTTLIPRTPYVTNTGKVVPHSVPLMIPQLKLVGMPVTFEEGLLPQALYQPIEMQLTAVLTERAMSEHTSRTAPDVIVSYREYRARFADPAQAIWRQHFPLALYTRKSVKQVVEKHRPGLFSILFKGSDLSKTEDQIFVGCDIRNRPSERASFYDWLMWRVEKARATWEYDYNNNVYRVMRRPERAQPFEVYAEDIGKVLTYYPEESRFQEWLLNDYVPAARQAQVPNLQGLTGVWQDHLFHSEVMLEFEAEWLQRISRWKMPDPEFVLHFKRFPLKPFSPGVGLKFDLDPMAFPNEHMVIPKEAQRGRMPSRVYRLRLRGESLEDDVSPIYQGRSDGKFKLQLAVWLQSSRDRIGRLPQYIQPRYPVDIEGVIACDNQGSMIYQYYTELLTNVKYYLVRIPLFYNQKIRVPYIPNKDTGHFYFPPYKNERVLVSLFSDRSEIKSFLDWRMTAETPLSTQGNQIVMGRELANGAAMRLWYAGEVPELWLQRYKDESFQYVRLYQSGVEMKSVQGPPKLGRIISAASKGAGAAQAAGAGQGGVTTIGIRHPVGGGGGMTGAHVAEPVRAAAKSEPRARRDGSLPVAPAARREQPGARQAPPAARREAVALGVEPVARQAARQSARAGAAVARASSPAPKVGPGAPPRGVRAEGGDVAVAERPAARIPRAAAKPGRAATARAAATGRAAATSGAMTTAPAATAPATASATAATGRRSGGATGRAARDAGAADPPAGATAGATTARRSAPAGRGKGRGAPTRAAQSDGGGVPPTRGAEGGATPPPGGSATGPGDGGESGGPLDEAQPVSPAPLESSLALDSASGVALALTDTVGGGAHGLTMKPAGLKLVSKVGAGESSLTQEGDVISLRARELNIDVDTIRVTAKSSASYQSLGQLTVSSLADLTLQTASAMTQTAMGGLTVHTLSLLISALQAIRLLAASGGVGVVGGGPGVEIFGSNFSATGLRSTLSGLTTDVLGTLVNLGQPGAAGGGEGLFPGLSAGDLASLAAVLQQLAPRPDTPTTHAYETAPGSATADPAAARRQDKDKDKDKKEKDKQDQDKDRDRGSSQDRGREPEPDDEPGEDRDTEAAAPAASGGREGAGPPAGAAPPDGTQPQPGATRARREAKAPPATSPGAPKRRRRRAWRRPLQPVRPPTDPTAAAASPEGLPVEARPVVGGEPESPVALMERLTALRAELTLNRTTHASTVAQVSAAVPLAAPTPAEEMDALLTAFEDQLAQAGLAAVPGLRAAVDAFRAAPGSDEAEHAAVAGSATGPGAAAAPTEPPPLPVPGLPPAVVASAEALAALFLNPVSEPPAAPPLAETGDAKPPERTDGADPLATATGSPGLAQAGDAAGAGPAAAAGAGQEAVAAFTAALTRAAQGPLPGTEDLARSVEEAARAVGEQAAQAQQGAGKAEPPSLPRELADALATASAVPADPADLAAQAKQAAQQRLSELQPPALPKALGDALSKDPAAGLVGAASAAAAAGLGGLQAGGKAAVEKARSVEKAAAEAADKGLGAGLRPPKPPKPPFKLPGLKPGATADGLALPGAADNGAPDGAAPAPGMPAAPSTTGGAAARAAGLAGAGAARPAAAPPSSAKPGGGPSVAGPLGGLKAPAAAPPPGPGATPGAPSAGSPGEAARSAARGPDAAPASGPGSMDLRLPPVVVPAVGAPLGRLGDAARAARLPGATPTTQTPPKPPGPVPGQAQARPPAAPPAAKGPPVQRPPAAPGPTSPAPAAGTQVAPLPLGVPLPVSPPPQALVVYRAQQETFESLKALVAPPKTRKEEP
jgi:hypothetical protein